MKIETIYPSHIQIRLPISGATSSIVFYFIIPLRSKKSAMDWNKVVYDFNITLSSVLNQRDSNFKVIVACTDVPDFPSDARVKIIEVPTMYRGIEDAMPDKNKKKWAMGSYIRAQGGGFIMPVDADDLVSNRISGLVNRGESEYGYLVNTGYEYDEMTKKIKAAPWFYKLCGTCAVFNCAPEDLPENFSDERPYQLLTSHTQWKKNFESKGTPLKRFPFRPVIKKINTGENYCNKRNIVGSKRRIIRKITKSSPISSKLRDEFNFHE